ncbi:GUN4 domain-containing protein [Oscillatoria acuminata]|uniref:GUN4 domain-containing protein n=1 Tax=Oscillatoria acuminata TaxID=118323 RepID=UPI001E3E6C95|nr:GUN4 domain-containing protein [Oscillatoria acuminata]
MDSLNDEISSRYQKLQQFLASGKWREADEETRRVMLQVAGREKERWLNLDDINQFPCEDLRQIDGLWVQYSNGRFGFSVQKRIWQECGGKVDLETEERLADRVGWKMRGKSIKNYDKLTFSTLSPPGNLPAVWIHYDKLTFSTVSPPGHLPAVGSWFFWLGPYWRGWAVSVFFSRVQTCKL